MKRAFIAVVDIFYVYQLLRHQVFTFRLNIKLKDGPTGGCLGSQVLMVGWGGVRRGGRIRACGTGHNGNCCADGDQGARAQAGNSTNTGSSASASASASSTSSGWWNRCATNWCRCLSHGLCGSKAQDCRSDQNFLHGISF